MKRRIENKKTMSKRLAAIVAGAVIIAQLSTNIPTFANEFNVGNNENTESISTNVDVLSDDIYTVLFDGSEKTDWKTLIGGGTHDVENGWLKITRNATLNNEFVFFDQNAPQIKDGEAEMIFKVDGDASKGAGRFGFVLRPQTDGAHLFVGYDLNGIWKISTKDGAYKTFAGPSIVQGEEYKLQVRFEGKKITIFLNDEQIFDEEVTLDGMPLNSSYGIGFKTWYGASDSYVDHFRVGNIGSIIGKDIAKKPIQSVGEVAVSTYVRLAPVLPTKVNVTYEDGTTGSEAIKWDYISKDKYAKPGEFTTEGTIIDREDRVTANVTVRSEAIEYNTDFNTPETSGDWQYTKGTGSTIALENEKLVLNTKGVSIAVDKKSPEIANGSYKTKFKYNSTSGRVGLVFRYVDEEQWASINYDASGNWVWETPQSYGNFGANMPVLENGREYEIEVKYSESKITLLIDGKEVAQQNVVSLPTAPGKIGLRSWFDNKIIELDYVSVKESNDGVLVPPETIVDEQTLKSENMNVVLDNNFPRVIRYEWKDGEVLQGEDEQLYIVKLNGDKYIPNVEFTQVDDKTAEYTLRFNELGLEMKLQMILVNESTLRMEVKEINENGSFKLKNISFPGHSLASVKNSDNGQISGVLTTGDWNNIKEEFVSVEDVKLGSYPKTYGIINDDKFAITVDNNVIEGGRRSVIDVSERYGYKKASLENGTWTYREEAGLEVVPGDPEELPWAQVMIARDTNNSGKVTWQDAAILYRNNMDEVKGSDYVRNSMSYIPFNIGSLAQSPFLRTGDMVKKLSNYTDGFGQLVLEKGYQGEGHDDVIADIGGHTGIRQGGKDDLNKLIDIGKDYNAKIGVHVNVTEYHLDAFELDVNNLQPGFRKGWGWKDESYYVDQKKDVTTGELERRFAMLKEDHPDLAWTYIDVYTGNGWNAKELADVINKNDWMVATEFNGPLEQQTAWTHWGGDPAYPNRGNESTITRFIRNQEQDVYMADDLLKGAKHSLSGGWGTRHDVEGFYGIGTFYNQTLPSKYMQHFEILEWEDDGTTGFVKFTDGLESRRENGAINMYQDGKLIATTPKNTIDDRGIGRTTLFIPWTWEQLGETPENKVYHWNPNGGETTWDLPNDWVGTETIKIYELSDLGKTFVEEIPVVNGKVTINAKADTPYVVFQEAVNEDRVDDWSEGTLVKDAGFDSQTFDYWEVTSKSGNTDHVSIVNEKVERRNGNDAAVISNGTDAKLSQKIEGLEPEKTYTASVWAKTNGDRKVTLGVNIDGKNIESSIDKETTRVNVGEGLKWHNEKITRMRVDFTVPEGVTTADLYVEADGVEDDTTVMLDDFRIWTNPLGIEKTNKDGYVLYEDFENVDEGHGPLYMGRNLGTDNRTHFAEKDPEGKQYMNWVINGRFSLKTNQQAGTTGEMLLTDQSTLQLKPNTTYELGFKYTNKIDNLYSVAIKSETAGNLLKENLTPGVVVGRPEDGSAYSREVKDYKVEFTTGSANDYYLAFEKGNGFDELILDDLYIKDLTPQDIVVSKPSNLEVSKVTSDSVNLSWEAPSNTNGLVGYTIYKDGKVFAEIDGKTSYTVIGLKKNTIYGFKVVSRYSNGEVSKPISKNIRTAKK